MLVVMSRDATTRVRGHPLWDSGRIDPIRVFLKTPSGAPNGKQLAAKNGLSNNRKVRRKVLIAVVCSAKQNAYALLG